LIPETIQIRLQNFFKTSKLSFQSVAGGSINSAFAFEVNHKKYFLKFNHHKHYPDIITFEVEGLKAIADTNQINTPDIVLSEIVDDYEILVLPFIANEQVGKAFWEKFGSQLAAMHKESTADAFGWHQDNYLGSLKQHNTQVENWTNFWTNQRVKPQLKLAVDSGSLNKNDIALFEKLFKEADNIFPKVRPCLVHGDLWSGNFIANNEYGPTLIDPAIHYSHFETDLAFTYLFGGFDSTFYKSYEESNALEHGFINRKDIYNLYPLLLHINLFGSAYYTPIKRTISRFS
jgi:fructosamine-3-kinase